MPPEPGITYIIMLNHLSLMFHPYRIQWLDLERNSVDWLLYKRINVLNGTNQSKTQNSLRIL